MTGRTIYVKLIKNNKVSLLNIPANRLDRFFERHQNEYEEKAISVLRSGIYISGPEVAAFEAAFAGFIGVPHCVSLASGSDALWVALHTLGIGFGDEVILQGNSFFATVLAVTRCGARPVFVEPDPTHYSIDLDKIEAQITPHTKAVLVTHLYGIMTPLDKLAALCRVRGLKLIEDCAQAHGARFKEKAAGSFGDIGCFSFYPTKTLGGFGDGGAIVTRDSFLAEQARVFCNYGKQNMHGDFIMQGTNSRLDELQAGLLRVRLQHLEDEIKEKRRIAARYLENICNPEIGLPETFPNTQNVWHQFVVRCERRAQLAKHLQQKGIGTAVHYPIPPHLTTAFRCLEIPRGALPVTEHLADTVLSLPSFFGLTQNEQDYILAAIQDFR